MEFDCSNLNDRILTLEKYLLIQCKRGTKSESRYDYFKRFCGSEIDHVEMSFHGTIRGGQ